MFDDIAAKNEWGMRDKISFNAWLEYGYSHICEAAGRPHPTLSEHAPPDHVVPSAIVLKLSEVMEIWTPLSLSLCLTLSASATVERMRRRMKRRRRRKRWW